MREMRNASFPFFGIESPRHTISTLLAGSYSDVIDYCVYRGYEEYAEIDEDIRPVVDALFLIELMEEDKDNAKNIVYYYLEDGIDSRRITSDLQTAHQRLDEIDVYGDPDFEYDRDREIWEQEHYSDELYFGK